MWNEMGTAPKDGTFVLLCGGKVSELHWEDHTPPMVVAYYDDGDWISSHFDSDCAFVRYIEPTYWMPLPPKADAAPEPHQAPAAAPE